MLFQFLKIKIILDILQQLQYQMTRLIQIKILQESMRRYQYYSSQQLKIFEQSANTYKSIYADINSKNSQIIQRPNQFNEANQLASRPNYKQFLSENSRNPQQLIRQNNHHIKFQQIKRTQQFGNPQKQVNKNNKRKFMNVFSKIQISNQKTEAVVKKQKSNEACLAEQNLQCRSIQSSAYNNEPKNNNYHIDQIIERNYKDEENFKKQIQIENKKIHALQSLPTTKIEWNDTIKFHKKQLQDYLNEDMQINDTIKAENNKNHNLKQLKVISNQEKTDKKSKDLISYITNNISQQEQTLKYRTNQSELIQQTQKNKSNNERTHKISQFILQVQQQHVYKNSLSIIDQKRQDLIINQTAQKKQNQGVKIKQQRLANEKASQSKQKMFIHQNQDQVPIFQISLKDLKFNIVKGNNNSGISGGEVKNQDKHQHEEGCLNPLIHQNVQIQYPHHIYINKQRTIDNKQHTNQHIILNNLQINIKQLDKNVKQLSQTIQTISIVDFKNNRISGKNSQFNIFLPNDNQFSIINQQKKSKCQTLPQNKLNNNYGQLQRQDKIIIDDIRQKSYQMGSTKSQDQPYQKQVDQHNTNKNMLGSLQIVQIQNYSTNSNRKNMVLNIYQGLEIQNTTNNMSNLPSQKNQLICNQNQLIIEKQQFPNVKEQNNKGLKQNSEYFINQMTKISLEKGQTQIFQPIKTNQTKNQTDSDVKNQEIKHIKLNYQLFSAYKQKNFRKKYQKYASIEKNLKTIQLPYISRNHQNGIKPKFIKNKIYYVKI